MSKRAPLVVSLAFAFALAVIAPVEQADAAVYANNKCVSAKLKEAGKKCKQLLKAWSAWDKNQDTAKRDLKIGKASSKFEAKWTKADVKAASKGSDCADTTITVVEAEQLVDDAVAALVAAINGGLTLAPAGTEDGKCGAKLIKEAAKKCDGIIKEYSKFIKNPAKDPTRAKLNDKTGKIVDKFEEKFDDGLADCPNSTATTVGVEALVDGLLADLRLGTTVSPNVSEIEFDTHTHPGPGQPGNLVDYEGDTLTPRCQDNSEYSFFVKRGTENKLLMYYQGGGVCWSGATCCLNTCDQDVNVAGSDNPNIGFGTGFADINNPNNPFRDWNIVFVSYCSCDIHTGDNGRSYGGPICNALAGVSAKAVEHRGYHNARLAEKFAREHFLDPEEVYVTGSSAGAFGALTHITPLARIYAAANVNHLADAGTFEPTQGFADTVFRRWGLTKNFESLKLDGITESVIQSPQILESTLTQMARQFPNVHYSHYLTAHDGGTGGLGGFYHVMVNHPYQVDPDDVNEADKEPALGTVTGTWPRWWDSTCAYNGVAETQMASIEATTAGENDNYHYYLGSGSRHTMFGSNKVYDSTLGGVDTIVDFINAERIKPTDPSWTTQIASPRNVLDKECKGLTNNGEDCDDITDCPDQGGGTSCTDDDPNPSPLECPFKTSGSDIVIDCVTCP
jgi:hypothetical protein